MKYENHSFNAAHVALLKVEDFIKQNTGNHFDRHTKAGNPEIEEQKLREVHALCVAEVAKAKVMAAPAVNAPAANAGTAVAKTADPANTGKGPVQNP